MSALEHRVSFRRFFQWPDNGANRVNGTFFLYSIKTARNALPQVSENAFFHHRGRGFFRYLFVCTCFFFHTILITINERERQIPGPRERSKFTTTVPDPFSRSVNTEILACASPDEVKTRLVIYA